MSDVQNVILASASSVRRDLLHNAGVPAAIEPAHIDESAIKESFSGEGTNAAEAALVLAQLKAQRISLRHGDDLVIGADQILDLDGHWFDKPPDMAHARGHLRALRGKTHILATAACVFRGGAQVWHTLQSPRLTMRAFSDDFLDDYLAQAGEEILSSVGAYRLEGIGIQLFDRIEGDYFAILGLPLLPLLDFLRANGAVRQ